MYFLKKKRNLIREIFSCREYLSKLYAIGIPSALYMMMNMFVNLVDTVMIGRLGETAIASVGLANKLFFVFVLINFGINSGSSLLAAQFFGHNDIKNLRKVTGLALTIACCNGLVFLIIGSFFSQAVMRIFSTDTQTVVQGAKYLRIVCLSYPPAAISGVYVAMLRSTGEVKIPLKVTIAAIIINIVCNYTLIFGAFGFPRMGVEGAAVATFIARVAETALTVGLTYRKKSILACKVNELYGYGRELIRQFVFRALPVIGNEFFWGIGITMYSVVYGRMGNEAISAITISSTLLDLTTVWVFGVSAATSVILGNELGANKTENAVRYANYSTHMSIMVSLLIMLILNVLKYPFMLLYDVGDSVKASAMACITVFSLLLPFRALGNLNIVGILRSGGDTVAGLFLDVSSVWCVGVPFAFLAGLVWKLPIHLVFALVNLDNVYKMVFSTIRCRQGKWIKNLAEEVQ